MWLRSILSFNRSFAPFVRSLILQSLMLISAYVTKNPIATSAPCPILRMNQHRDGTAVTCSGLPRSTNQEQDDRPVYYNMTGRKAIDIIRNYSKTKLDCRPGAPIPTLSIRYESNVAFREQAESAVRVANQMTYLLTRGACGAEKSRTLFDVNDETNDHYLYSLARNTFSIDEKVLGAGIIFRKGALKEREYFGPYSLIMNGSYTVGDRTTRIGEEEKALLRYLENRAKERTYACSTSIFTPNLNDTQYGAEVNITQPYVEYIDGSWGRPYFECFSSKKWLVPYMAPFFRFNYSAPREDILVFM